MFTSPRRLFTSLTSELNSHLGVHEDHVGRRGIDFHAVVHAQPPHLTYLSHIPAYRDDETLNRRLLRWEPESIVALSQGVRVLPFYVPGSQQMMDANVAGLREAEITLWSKHGVMARSDLSVTRAVDRIEYAETGARYEYMNLAAGGHAEGLSRDEIRSVADAFAISSPGSDSFQRTLLPSPLSTHIVAEPAFNAHCCRASAQVGRRPATMCVETRAENNVR